MTDYLMTCSDCDELLSGYFEGDLDAQARAKVDEHVASCARCQGLVRDVDAIIAEAASLPELVPSKDLWQGIESRIEPEVVSIAARRESTVLSRRMLAVAAAALVVISSSVTYLATSRSVGRSPRARQVVEAPRAVPVIGATDETGPNADGLAGREAPASDAVGSPAEAGASSEAVKPADPSRSESRVGNAPRRSSGGTALVSRTNAPVSASELALSEEIGHLQALLRQKRNDLDPSTVQVVEDNLNVIDVAVKQARAALARDPASGFLTEQLDNALQKKVELLRTVALLPSKT
jgi:anti-sigma factor RsiW